jgi:transglutaminase-like putative cysteine protease
MTSNLASGRLGSEFGRRPPNRGGNGPTAGSTLAMPAMGAVASICSATAISGVVAGLGWLSYAIVSVVVCVATGTAMRALRVPGPVIWVGQLFVLLCLTVTLFTSSGFLVVLPGPTALHDLGVVFGQAGADIQNGIPPVAADQPILCLVVLAIGGVAIAVDTLAVTAKVPAAAGLILLCVYAVPASLDDQLLPWWSFVLGAAAFTVLLAVDGVQRHQAWRGKLGLPTVATTGVAPATAAVTTVAVVLALFVGATFTVIGTVGRLPGSGGNGDGVTGQLGIEPFTKLQGMLGNQGNAELFDVTGLPSNSPPYLQAITLPDYVAGQGWVTSRQMPAGVAANGPLPYAPGEPAGDPTTKITIQSVNWKDVWLPTFGLPNRLQGVAVDYRYDRDSGIVYSVASRQPGSYTETADLTVPTQFELEAVGQDYSAIDPKYLRISGVDHRVVQLATDITANSVTEFDKAQALFSYFHNANNGFTYSTQTAKPVTGDPLVDFLVYGKTGFCEQFASAMGAMLRTLGIPARIALGFTDGFASGGHQTITTQDAHAWVQVYFAGYGWVNFDPTPLGDGRQQVPGFLPNSGTNGANSNAGRQNPDRQPADTTPTPAAKQPAPTHPTPSGVGRTSGPSGPPSWQVWMVLVLVLVAAASTVMARRRGAPPVRRRWLSGALTAWGLLVFFALALLSWWLSVLVLVLGVAAAPAVIREIRRRRHHRAVAERGPAAANAAWDELMAESLDRGMAVPPSDTLRVAAHRMVREHDLDAEGRDSLRTLVGEVERSWYGAPATSGPSSVVVESFDRVRRSLHRNAPLALRARLLPRSVLRPAKGRKSDADDQDE